MKRLRRWLPHPLMSLALLLVWLLLVNTVAPGHIVLGALLGIVIPRFTDAFWPERPQLRKPGLALRFALLVTWDIVIANLNVARLILGPKSALRPRLVRFPLDLRDEFAITLLASTISLTPGTVSTDVSPDRRSLLIHGLDVDDEEALIAQIKRRYEARLKEIFEC